MGFKSANVLRSLAEFPQHGPAGSNVARRGRQSMSRLVPWRPAKWGGTYTCVNGINLDFRFERGTVSTRLGLAGSVYIVVVPGRQNRNPG